MFDYKCKSSENISNKTCTKVIIDQIKTFMHKIKESKYFDNEIEFHKDYSVNITRVNFLFLFFQVSIKGASMQILIIIDGR